jgi:hypothetical protein
MGRGFKKREIPETTTGSWQKRQTTASLDNLVVLSSYSIILHPFIHDYEESPEYSDEIQKTCLFDKEKTKVEEQQWVMETWESVITELRGDSLPC